MNEQELKNLVNEIRMLPRETEWVEFKSSTIKPDEKLGDYISGLSNAACINNQPFAYLLLGVDNDDHSVKGSNYNFTARKHGKASKEEIDELILDILPAVLDKKQKQNKVRNLIYAMHKRDKTIENKGTTRHPIWVLASSNSERTTSN